MRIYARLGMMTLVIAVAFAIFKYGYNVSETKYLKLKLEATQAADAERLTYQKAADGLARALLNQEMEKEIIYETITKRVNVYITSKPECDINYGAYGLLHNAVTGTDPDKGEYSTLTDEEAARTAITRTQLTETAISFAKQYNAARNKYHKLQDSAALLPCVIN